MRKEETGKELRDIPCLCSRDQTERLWIPSGEGLWSGSIFMDGETGRGEQSVCGRGERRVVVGGEEEVRG